MTKSGKSVTSVHWMLKPTGINLLYTNKVFFSTCVCQISCFWWYDDDGFKIDLIAGQPLFNFSAIPKGNNKVIKEI